jgi:single-stranded-DNA-specific exonuclease
MTVEAINEHLLWVYPKEDSALVEYFIKEFNIHPATAQVLVSRKYKKRSDVHSFLYAKLPQLHSPDLLLGIENATQRIHTALKNKEKILIFGDNDVDGISGATLLVDFLRTLGANVYFYIPNRNLHRDTIILDAMEYALSTAANEIKELTAKGIDVIITDHHEPTDKLPHCIATLNPKLINSVYPNRDLTGVGVAFKLAHAMIN